MDLRVRRGATHEQPTPFLQKLDAQPISSIGVSQPGRAGWHHRFYGCADFRDGAFALRERGSRGHPKSLGSGNREPNKRAHGRSRAKSMGQAVFRSGDGERRWRSPPLTRISVLPVNTLVRSMNSDRSGPLAGARTNSMHTTTLTRTQPDLPAIRRKPC